MFFVVVEWQRGLVEFICSVFVCSWTGVIRYHGPRPSTRPKQVEQYLRSGANCVKFFIRGRVVILIADDMVVCVWLHV